MKKIFLLALLLLVIIQVVAEDFIINVDMPAGSPTWLGYPIVADLDNNGDNELIVTSLYAVHVFNADGTYYPSWPMEFDAPLVHGSVAIADFNNDHVVEIVFLQRFNWNCMYNSIVHVMEPDGTYYPGWPVTISELCVTECSPSIGDINNDGSLDIIFGTGANIEIDEELIFYNTIYAFNNDGSLISGWPVETISDNVTPYSSPVLVDLYNDGYKEIVIGCMNWVDPSPNGASPDGGFIDAFDYAGNRLAGFPVYNDRWNWSVIAADLNNDGWMEIFAHQYQYNWCGGNIPWQNENRYPISMSAVGDINSDGQNEIIFGSVDPGEVYVTDGEGNVLSGWPVVTEDYDVVDGNFVIGDIDSDGYGEIFVGSYDTQRLFGWHHDGTVIEGFPKENDGRNRHIAIDDLDNDGDVDIISASDCGIIYFYDLPGEYNVCRMDWPTFQCNNQRTGVFSNPIPVSTEDVEVPIGIELGENYPNPFNPSTTIDFTIAESSEVKLTVYNIKGQKIKTLVDDNLESGQHNVVWNAEGIPSGVYFCRMISGQYISTRKMILMK